MKSLVKLAGAFALGIIVTVAVIAPKVSQTTAEPPATPDIQSGIVQTIDAAETEATPVELKAEIAVEAVAEEIRAVTTPEPTYSPVSQKAEVKAETAPKSAAEVKQASPPQAKAAQPETWWEDGKQYTMINGHKALISDEGNNQLSYYDWENDPLKDVPGPFNGNGGN